jgi:septal ring factor EnvC (AmiA/AmiB activator)
MGFGSTAKKLQTVVDMADDLYAKLSELATQLKTLQNTAEETADRVDAIDDELAEQRELLEALASEHDIDPDDISVSESE